MYKMRMFVYKKNTAYDMILYYMYCTCYVHVMYIQQVYMYVYECAKKVIYYLPWYRLHVLYVHLRWGTRNPQTRKRMRVAGSTRKPASSCGLSLKKSDYKLHMYVKA